MSKKNIDLQEKRRETLRQLALAEEGEAPSQNALGARLAQGYFVRKNLSGALYWYFEAVKQGYTHAKWNAGAMLVAGEGVASRYEDIGMRLIEQAARAGDPSACNFLSKCFAQGKFGKTANLEVSNQWEKAAQDATHFTEYGEPVDIESFGIPLSKPDIVWKD